jgi:MFS family permease
MTLVYATAALPAGALADRGHAHALLGAGVGALVASDVVLALAHTGPAVLAGAALWGLHMALTQGLLAALVAAAAPADLRGTAFGVFNLASGVALLVASVLAGYLWQSFGPAATFAAGAAFATIAGIALWVQRSYVPRLDEPT